MGRREEEDWGVHSCRPPTYNKNTMGRVSITKNATIIGRLESYNFSHGVELRRVLEIKTGVLESSIAHLLIRTCLPSCGGERGIRQGCHACLFQRGSMQSKRLTYPAFSPVRTPFHDHTNESRRGGRLHPERMRKKEPGAFHAQQSR
jgi:hypothetical protein